jgi:lipopolysaccharide transport system permease protein
MNAPGEHSVAKTITSADAGAPQSWIKTTIRPPKLESDLGLTELLRYSHYIYILFWRDLKVRYKQSILGVGWVLVQPVVMMVVFSTIFGQVAKIPSDGIPYPIFSFTGLLPWLLFQRSLVQGGASLITYKSELTKIYFPRLIAPISTFASSLFDFLLSLTVLAGLMAFYGMRPGWQIVFLPLFVLYIGCAAMSVVLWLSALNVEYRDIQQLIPFLVQVWMYMTPIVYPLSMVPKEYHLLYALNPMAGVIEAFRWTILDKAAPDPMFFLISSGVIFLMGTTGLRYFRRVSHTIADRI